MSKFYLRKWIEEGLAQDIDELPSELRCDAIRIKQLCEGRVDLSADQVWFKMYPLRERVDANIAAMIPEHADRNHTLIIGDMVIHYTKNGPFHGVASRKQ